MLSFGIGRHYFAINRWGVTYIKYIGGVGDVMVEKTHFWA